MYDIQLVLDILTQIIEAVEEVKNKCKYAKCVEDFYLSSLF